MTETAMKSVTHTTCALEQPITRGETTITTVNLRRPSAGELRGLSLQDLLRADVGAIITLVPRISDPALIAAEVETLCPADLAELAGAISGFFLTAAQRDMMAQMMSTG